jgi:carbonic anhydrase/acetyltransferase-like protein (isoleucine patch superfamily)
MIRSYLGMRPRIAAGAYIDESAQVIGDVEVGERSGVWMCSVLRGDVNYIRIGSETNIQDNSVLHVIGEPSHPLIIGDGVTVGHNVVLHGCLIESDCLIGIGAIVLNGARIGAGSIIGSGALVTEGTVVPPGSLFLGNPARLKRAATEEELKMIRRYAAHYAGYAANYLKEQRECGRTEAFGRDIR